VRVFALMLVVTAMRIAPVAQETLNSGTVTVIRMLEKQWTVGQARNDGAALDLWIRAQPPGTDQITMEPMNVRISGNTAIVVGSYFEKQTAGQSRPIKRWRFVDTWINKKNGWVLVAAAAAPVTE
jgi:hypothetical protein